MKDIQLTEEIVTVTKQRVILTLTPSEFIYCLKLVGASSNTHAESLLGSPLGFDTLSLFMTMEKFAKSNNLTAPKENITPFVSAKMVNLELGIGEFVYIVKLASKSSKKSDEALYPEIDFDAFGFYYKISDFATDNNLTTL
jgi:hypothetical protein